jgi:(S)-ureidoglycine-glyoxylate aminotransferase
MASVLEPGDRVVVGVIGRFGELLSDLARRAGAEVFEVAAEWGRVIEPDRIRAALEQHRPKLVAVVQGETSTGMCQPLEGLGQMVHEYDAIFMVDAVPTLGGIDLPVDRWDIDVCVTGLQKCLGGPSGMAPLTYGARVSKALEARKAPVSSNYLDLTQVQNYWTPARYNHHTAPTSMVYALREALRIVYEEGLETRFKRHDAVSRALRAGLEETGLELFGDRSHALATITPVVIPDRVDDRQARAMLLEDFNVEIGMAFGPLLGKVWRIGTMGYNAQLPSILHLLAGLEQVLTAQGFRVPPGAGTSRALDVWRELAPAS